MKIIEGSYLTDYAICIYQRPLVGDMNGGRERGAGWEEVGRDGWGGGVEEDNTTQFHNDINKSTSPSHMQ